MKKGIKRVLCVVIFLLLICSVSAKKKVIDSPAYEARSTGLFEIARIEWDEKETLVHIKSTFLPNWWVSFDREDYISDSKGEEKLKAIDILNGEFDKEMFMPASGDSTFILVFPSLDKKVKKINFGGDKGVQIWGVSLEKKANKKDHRSIIPVEVKQWMEKEIRDSARPEAYPLETSFFTDKGIVRLVGYIKGYDSRFDLKTGMVYASNDISREDFPTVVKIHPDGRFEAEIPAIHPLIYYINFNRTNVYFYGEPGVTTAVVLDWEDFLRADRFRDRQYVFEKNEYAGPFKRINEELFSIKYPQPDYRSMPDKMKTQSYEDFKQEIIQQWEEAKDMLSRDMSEKSLLPETIEILKRRIDMEYVTFLLDFAGTKPYYMDNPEDHMAPEHYYDFLTSVSLSDSLLMVTDHFSTFINRFEYMPAFRKVSTELNKQRMPGKDIFDFLREDMDVVFSEEDEEYLEFANSFPELLRKATSDEERDKYVEDIQKKGEEFSKKYKDFIEEYKIIYLEPLGSFSNSQYFIDEWKLKEQILKEELSLFPGLISDVPKIRAIQYLFEHYEQEDAGKVVYYLLSHLHEPFLKLEAQRIYNAHFHNENKAYELPEGEAANLFRQIIEPYKGKYLLVDFWATWCGPCVHGIKSQKEMRSRLKGDPDIAFLFITSEEDSPRDQYSSFVEEQEMEHSFLITGDEYRYFRELFRFNGIPRYILVGPDGRIMDDNYSYHKFIQDMQQITGREDL